MGYASGTLTPSREHEKMTQSTQRKVLRLVVQTKRKYKKKIQSSNEEKGQGGLKKKGKEKDGEEEKQHHGSSEDETDDGSSSSTDCDQDSDISFMNGTDEETDTAEVEEEEWIEYMKWSTAVAIERVKQSKSQAGSKHTVLLH